MSSHRPVHADSDGLAAQAKSLIQGIVDRTDKKYGFGTLSCTVYDTAWVSLVVKPVNGRKHWLFPQCFQYLVRTQHKDGSWSGDTGAQVGGVLNTMAGLLAMKRYRAEPLQHQIDAGDLDARISLATSALRCRMEAWDVSRTNTVGFEVIIPAMLEMLQREDAQLVFEFKGKEALLDMYKAKMARFKPEMLYDARIMTLTHSLEALIGQINFDKLTRHTVMGSMFASPSSTAAYLMNVSTWDDEAELYLRHSIKASAGEGSGGVPGVFPTTHFESTWILSTLLRAGFTPSELDCPALSKIEEALLKAYHKENGAIGLAPGIEPDVDDSAKIITTLNMLDNPIGARPLCQEFEVATHFRVYPWERDASFSANCNVLAALLQQPDVETYSTQISKVSRFLLDKKWNADDKIEDKWASDAAPKREYKKLTGTHWQNTSHLYSSFLFVEVMVDLIALVESGKLSGLFDQESLARIAIVLFQSCLRAQLGQERDGSWNHSSEETAYAILMLTEARRLCFFQHIMEPLSNSIERGIAFFGTPEASAVDYIWSDKVSYGSACLTATYILAAKRAASCAVSCESVGASIWQDHEPQNMDARISLFRRTPLLESVPEWELRASMIEATIYQPLLRDSRLEVLDRGNIGGGKYLTMIPFTWTSCNNKARTYASPAFLWEMMTLSFFTYQIDEFMEGVAAPAFKHKMGALHQVIDQVTSNKMDTGGVSNGDKSNGQLENPDARVASELSRAVRFILENSTVRESSPYDQNTLRQELQVFLHAHTTQCEDNQSVGKGALQQDITLASHATSFFRWVRTTSADHIAGAFCFYYAISLLGSTLAPRRAGSSSSSSSDCFPTTMEKYLAAATCGHLSSMCRMYNDLGSWARDRDEGNLSCIHFPEFGGAAVDEDTKKATLFRVAQYERSRWGDCLRQLAQEMQAAAPNAAAKRLAGRRASIVEMFCDVTDLYGQVYVLRDISAPINGDMRNGH